VGVSTVAPSPRDGNEPVPTLLTAPGDAARLATFAALFGQSPIGLGIFDEECRYVLVNEALQSIIGLPASQVVGRRVEDVLGQLGLSGTPLVNQEFVGATYAHEGEPRAFLASYFGLADEDGRLLGAASLVNDITDQRRIREELTAANERLSLLTRVSGALASCLVEQDALTSFAQLVVPAFADHCLVDLVDDDGEVRRAALVHAEGLAPERGRGRCLGVASLIPRRIPSSGQCAPAKSRSTSCQRIQTSAGSPPARSPPTWRTGSASAAR
jgi:PAS domain S-box-containing protein